MREFVKIAGKHGGSLAFHLPEPGVGRVQSFESLVPALPTFYTVLTIYTKDRYTDSGVQWPYIGACCPNPLAPVDQMPVLYHHPMSTASRFVRLIFSEYGVPSELIEEQIWEKRKDFMGLNPAGTLPVYVDDNMRALCGATIISEFLDETSGVLKRDRRLLAEDPFQRAEIRRLTEWFLFKMEQDVTRPLVRERVFKLYMTPDQGGGAPDSKVLRTARGNIKQHLRYLAWLAGSRTWLAGERLTYADLAAAASISVLDYLGEIEWSDVPQVKEWYQRIKSRPGFRPLLNDRVRSVTPVSHYADLDF